MGYGGTRPGPGLWLWLLSDDIYTRCFTMRDEMIGRLRWVILMTAVLPLWGCGKPCLLVDTPVIYTDAKIDPLDHLSPEFQSTEVDLFYATNRKRKGEMHDPIYTNGMDEVLRLGDVSVRLGEEGLSWSDLHVASTRAEREMEIPVTVTEVTEYGVLGVNVSGKKLKRPLAEDYTIGDAAFAAAINKSLARTSAKEINVYIHGFKMPFDHGPQVAAQLHHFGARRGVMIAFDWASRQMNITYASDVKRAQRSVDDLVEFLAFLSTHTGAERINIIAWSAGGPIMSKALRTLRERYPDLDHTELFAKLKLHTIIFTASDNEFRYYLKELVHFSEIPERVVVTVSNEDAQLKLSRAIHLGKSRLGSLILTELEPGELEALRPYLHRFEFIDITYAQGAISKAGMATGHDYFYLNPWVLSDVLCNLYLDLPAEKRGLQHEEGHTYAWYFPDDYAQRVAASIHAIVRSRSLK